MEESPVHEGRHKVIRPLPLNCDHPGHDDITDGERNHTNVEPIAVRFERVNESASPLAVVDLDGDSPLWIGSRRSYCPGDGAGARWGRRGLLTTEEFR